MHKDNFIEGVLLGFLTGVVLLLVVLIIFLPRVEKNATLTIDGITYHAKLYGAREDK